MTRNLVQRAGDVLSAPNLNCPPEGGYFTFGAKHVSGAKAVAQASASRASNHAF